MVPRTAVNVEHARRIAFQPIGHPKQRGAARVRAGVVVAPVVFCALPRGGDRSGRERHQLDTVEGRALSADGQRGVDRQRLIDRVFCALLVILRDAGLADIG